MHHTTAAHKATFPGLGAAASRPRMPVAEALLLLFGLAACSLPSRPRPTPLSEFAAEVDDPEVLEHNARIQIPITATNLRGYVDGFREPATYITFTLHASELEAFLSGTLCRQPLEPLDPALFPESSTASAWWTLGPTDGLSYCHGSEEHLSQEIFVGRSGRPSVYTVYVIASVE